MEIKVINKYILFNKDREILVFFCERNNLLNVFLPREFTNETEEKVEFQRELIQLLNKSVMTEEIKVLLCAKPMRVPNYEISEEENCLYKIIKKNYFACYTDFDDELVRAINELCYYYHICPYLIPLNDLKQKAWESIGKAKDKREISIDISLPVPLKKLRNKLNYIEY